MIKSILQSFITARRFELNMRMYGAILKKQKTNKVRITKDQMEILEFCAVQGVKTVAKLKSRTLII